MTAIEPDLCASGPAPVTGRGEQESRLLTVLVADIRGYTRFTAERGDEAAARLTGRFATIANVMVEQRGGQVLELRGDEVLAVFDSPRQALRAALELQARFREEMEHAPDLPLKVGMGVDAGEVVPVQGGYRGGVLNLAARLCSLAGPGEVFASEMVVGLARRTEGLVYIDRGEVQLKGLRDPVRVIQVTSEGDTPGDVSPLQQIIVTHPNNLPDEPTQFIGRERQITTVAELLHRPKVRLVTLTGPGGTGKTRLALQVGAMLLYDFEDGVFFVSLDSIMDPDLVASRIATTLALKETGGAVLTETLKQFLHDKHLLLVLDNFEHLLEAGYLVAELLDTCPELHVLVTSRSILHLSREHCFEVPPLAVPDPKHVVDLQSLSHYEAVALFIARAQAAKATFSITNENAPAVAEICYRLDGLPLAIELAAARIRLFTPQALLGRLSSRLKLLTGGARDLPVRQQTLRGAIAWSYSLLHEDEQLLFERLAVFMGGCTLGAVETVCNAEGDLQLDPLDGVASLAEKSLVHQNEGEGDEPRFVMLETIREYALERLESRADAAALRRHHALYFVAFAEEAVAELQDEKQASWITRIEEEHDNLRAALSWAQQNGEVEIGLRLAAALRPFWQLQGYLSEGRTWLEELLALQGDDGSPASSRVRARALNAAAWLVWRQSDRGRAAELFERSLELSRQLEDLALMVDTLGALGYVRQEEGDFGQSTALFEERLALARALGDKRRIAESFLQWRIAAQYGSDRILSRSSFEDNDAARQTEGAHGDFSDVSTSLLDNLGAVVQDVGDVHRATALLEENLTLLRTVDDKRSIIRLLEQLAGLLRDRGDYERAIRLYEEGLMLQRQLGETRGIAMHLRQLGWLATEQGNYERATQLLKEALQLHQDAEDTFGVALTLLTLGDVACYQGDAEQVNTYCQKSLALFRELGLKEHVAWCFNNLGLAARQQGEYERAAALLEESLMLLQEIGLGGGIPEVQLSLGLVARDRGYYTLAKKLLAESLRQSRTVGPMWVVATALEAMGAIAGAQGETERAARIFGAAEALRVSMRVPMWPASRPLYERDLGAIREALGASAFAAAWSKGHAMPLDDAIALALGKATESLPPSSPVLGVSETPH